MKENKKTFYLLDSFLFIHFTVFLPSPFFDGPSPSFNDAVSFPVLMSLFLMEISTSVPHLPAIGIKQVFV